MPNLLASLDCNGETHLIIGASNVASIRINSIIESGANPILISPSELIDEFPQSIQNNIKEGKLKWISKYFEVQDLTRLGREDVDKVVDRVFVTLPLSEFEMKKAIFDACKKLRIPINVSDSPEFCSFTLLSTFNSGDFQMGVTTSGKGCKLASRIKRELANTLPSNIGEICDKVGELRTRIQQEDKIELEKLHDDIERIGEHDDDAINTNKLNSLVEEFNMTKEQKKLQRARWLSQIVEYYPLSKLADLSLDDLAVAYHEHKNLNIPVTDLKKQKDSSRGSISLVGSGPGSISLLTLGALQEIHFADLILADKLVPQQVLDLIPRRTRLFIARKFPGNAEKAQEELLSMGLESLLKGEKVVRLKQGDPYIFGRGGEEYKFFAAHGFPPVVIPGITSALAAPVLTNIPATHRDVADQVLICTGTGRRGALPNLPDFVKSRTTVFLMALHRAVDLIPKLIKDKDWDPALPVAIIERASCPDQRIIRTTLTKVPSAVEACGSRPPGLLVTGYACEVINNKTNEEDWIIEEGFKDTRKEYLEPFLNFPSIIKDSNTK